MTFILQGGEAMKPGQDHDVAFTLSHENRETTEGGVLLEILLALGKIEMEEISNGSSTHYFLVFAV